MVELIWQVPTENRLTDPLPNQAAIMAFASQAANPRLNRFPMLVTAVPTPQVITGRYRMNPKEFIITYHYYKQSGICWR